MVRLDTGSDKVQQICDALRLETLDPAKKEAARIIEEAHASAEQILEAARQEISTVKKKCDEENDQKRQVLESSLRIGAKKTISALKEAVAEQIFQRELVDWVQSASKGEDVIASIVNAVVSSIEKEGLSADLEVQIPKLAAKEKVAQAVVGKAMEKGEVSLGEFVGGAKVRMVDRNLVIDLSDEALKNLLAGYVAAELREYVFSE